MALQAWMKKEGVFDRDICRELNSQFGIEDPEYDFSKISKAQWKKFQKALIQQKKQEIKDNTAIRRLEQKFSKINKKWKSQQGKKFKDTASVTKKSGKSPKKAVDQSNSSPKKRKNAKQKKGKSKMNQMKAMNPRHVEYILSCWLRRYSIDESKCKYKNIAFSVMILKYCPTIFGFGDDGVLTIKQNKEYRLRSDQLYQFESIILKKKAVLTVDVWKTRSPLQEYTNMDGSGGALLLKVNGSIVMNEGSKITVKACGYPGGYGKGVKGGKGMGMNKSGGEAGEWTSATGAAYVSKGVGNETLSGALILGSGGGGITSTANRFFPGGVGGGVLKIECSRLIFKGAGCVLSASGQTSIHGGGGSGGVLWLRCLSIQCKNDGIWKQCKIVNKGGKGDGDEYSEGKENAEDGRIRIDLFNKSDVQRMKSIVKCKNVYYGSF